MKLIIISHQQYAVIGCLLNGMNLKDMSKHLKMRPSIVKQTVSRIGRRMHIDAGKYCLRVRIVYLILSGQMFVYPGKLEGTIDLSYVNRRIAIDRERYGAGVGSLPFVPMHDHSNRTRTRSTAVN